MKRIYLLALTGFMLMGTGVWAQKENVGIGTKSPDASAVLDIQSTSKGLLIPRMTFEQRAAITRPADGLMIYQTNDKSGFYFYNGNTQTWSPLSGSEAKSVMADPNDWTKAGNAGTNPVNDFLGTTDGQPLVFRTNNQISGYIDFSSAANKKNTFLGQRSGANALTTLTGGSNTGIGFFALRKVTSGTNNTAIGTQSLGENLSGAFNTAIGTSSMATLSSGDRNFALGANAMVLATSGSDNVAIGNNVMHNSTSPSNNLGIGTNALFNNQGSGNVALGFSAGYNESGSNKLYISNSNTANPLIKGDFADKNLRINVGANNGTANSATTLGYMAIGNFDAGTPMAIPSGYRLIVESGILTEKIKVAVKSTSVGGDWADYVFEPDYKMMSLEEVEAFTKENKHLPNVPSANEMVENGLDVGQTSKMFMEKIEELTLYLIELNKEVKALKLENEMLKEKLK